MDRHISTKLVHNDNELKRGLRLVSTLKYVFLFCFLILYYHLFTIKQTTCMPNTNYLITSPCNHHSPLATSPQRGTSSSIPMSPCCDLDRGSRHIVSWAPVTFFFLSRYVFFFYYTNEYQWFKFSRTYVWTWQGQQGRGKGSRCVVTHLVRLFLVCSFFFSIVFSFLSLIFLLLYILLWRLQ